MNLYWSQIQIDVYFKKTVTFITLTRKQFPESSIPRDDCSRKHNSQILLEICSFGELTFARNCMFSVILFRESIIALRLRRTVFAGNRRSTIIVDTYMYVCI